MACLYSSLVSSPESPASPATFGPVERDELFAVRPLAAERAVIDME
jgi:hypothetical protein